MRDSFDELRELFVPGQLVECSWEYSSCIWQSDLLLVLSASVGVLDTYMIYTYMYFHACLLRTTGERINAYYTMDSWPSHRKFWKRVAA